MAVSVLWQEASSALQIIELKRTHIPKRFEGALPLGRLRGQLPGADHYVRERIYQGK